MEPANSDPTANRQRPLPSLTDSNMCPCTHPPGSKVMIERNAGDLVFETASSDKLVKVVANTLYIPSYIHTYIRTYVRTYVRTYIHTYIQTTYLRYNPSKTQKSEDSCPEESGRLLTSARQGWNSYPSLE